jgi:hypothetical protein
VEVSFFLASLTAINFPSSINRHFPSICFQCALKTTSENNAENPFPFWWCGRGSNGKPTLKKFKGIREMYFCTAWRCDGGFVDCGIEAGWMEMKGRNLKCKFFYIIFMSNSRIWISMTLRKTRMIITFPSVLSTLSDDPRTSSPSLPLCIHNFMCLVPFAFVVKKKRFGVGAAWANRHYMEINKHRL